MALETHEGTFDAASLRRRTFEELFCFRLGALHDGDGAPRRVTGEARRPLSWSNRFIILAILLAVFVTVLRTEPSLTMQDERLLVIVNVGLGLFFAAEMMLRLWSIAEDDELGAKISCEGARDGPWARRWAYLRSPWSILDIVSILPFLIVGALNECVLLRVARLFRLVTLVKMARYFSAFHVVATTIYKRRYEIAAAFVLSFFLLIAASTVLYLLEGRANAQAFGSIPRAMWWSVGAFTGIGAEGTPMTALGRIFAALSALAGIAMVTLPTGILAGAFAEVFEDQSERSARTSGGVHEREPAPQPVPAPSQRGSPDGGVPAVARDGTTG